MYTSAAFSTRCQELGVIQSMGAIGTSADNALAESFNSTMKREVLRNRKVFDNPLQCRREVFRWCIRYNTQRRHSWGGQVSPDVFEAQSITLTKAALLPLTLSTFRGSRPSVLGIVRIRPPILINRGLIIGHGMRTHLRDSQHAATSSTNPTVTTWTPTRQLVANVPKKNQSSA